MDEEFELHLLENFAFMIDEDLSVADIEVQEIDYGDDDK